LSVFFRWVKCLLGCRHWLAESPSGVSHQLYLALIAAVLLQQALGRRPNRPHAGTHPALSNGRGHAGELLAGLRSEAERAAARRKNP